MPRQVGQNGDLENIMSSLNSHVIANKSQQIIVRPKRVPEQLLSLKNRQGAPVTESTSYLPLARLNEHIMNMHETKSVMTRSQDLQGHFNTQELVYASHATRNRFE